MKYSRTAAFAAIVGLAVVGLGAQASLSGAEDGAGVYGMIDTLDPLVGSDWAPPVADPEVAQAAANGATVTDEPCTFGGRPGAPGSQIFRAPVSTTGHLVVTPSGNVSFVCHAAAEPKSFRPPLPSQALVIDGAPCFLPSGRRTSDSHLVVTPSLRVHLVCHFHPTS
jgi:hypothetical protein